MDVGSLLSLFEDQAPGTAAREQERTYTEEEIVALLSRQVSFLLENSRDWLLGKLYRLDIRERDILAALEVPGSDPARALSRLIVERQKERAEAKLKFSSPPLSEEEEDLRW